jgi:hypothetical protein
MNEEAPEELSIVWDDQIKAAFQSLSAKYQEFLLSYLRCWNAAQAYREIYNPLANAQTASSCGSRLLAHASIQTVLKRFTDTRTEDLLLVKAVFKEAATEAIKPIFGKDEDGQPIKIEDIPDYDTRVKAGNHLAKLAKLYDDEEIDPDSPDAKPKRTLTIGGVKVEIQ